MFKIKYKGLRLIPSKSAMREMVCLGFMIRECKKILKNGYKAPRRRSKATEERWIDKGSKTYNVVIVRSYNYMYKEEVYLITHVGEFKKTSRREK